MFQSPPTRICLSSFDSRSQMCSVIFGDGFHDEPAFKATRLHGSKTLELQTSVIRQDDTAEKQHSLIAPELDWYQNNFGSKKIKKNHLEIYLRYVLSTKTVHVFSFYGTDMLNSTALLDTGCRPSIGIQEKGHRLRWSEDRSRGATCIDAEWTH